MLTLGSDHPQVFVSGLEVHHLGHRHQVHYMVHPSLYHLQPRLGRGCRRTGCTQQLPQLVQCLLKCQASASLWLSSDGGTVGQPGLEPRHAGRQARRIHRLDEVVHRLGLEGLQRVLVVGGDKDQQGERHAIWPILGQRLRRVQPAGAGHPDVEKADIGLQRQPLPRRAEAVGQLGDDAQFGPEPGQFSRQRSGQQRLVFGDQGAGHDQRQGLRFMLPLILQCFSGLVVPPVWRQ